MCKCHVGDKPVEQVFCQNFTASQQGVGEVLAVPLCPEGEDRLVTEETRREYVELYINHVLNTSVHRQVFTFTLGLEQDAAILRVQHLPGEDDLFE